MIIIIQAFAVGLLVGTIFALVRVPIPAPPTLAGVAGILGITIGYIVITSTVWRS